MTDLESQLDHVRQLRQQGRLGDAEQLCREIVAAEPNCIAAVELWASVHTLLGQHDKAFESWGRAVALRPDNAEALTYQGDSLHRLGRFEQALACYDRALAVEPRHDRALCNRAVALNSMGRFEEALAAHDRAIAVNPSSVTVLTNRSATLHQLGRLDEALASCDRILAVKADQAHAWFVRGLVLYDLNRLNEAVQCLDRAVALEPGHAQAHWKRAATLLATGDFDNGWKAQEYRWQLNWPDGPQSFPQPLWRGDASLAGKTILLHAEQGLGDTIQFCRYAPMVSERGARVILQVQRPLRSLMESLTGPEQVVAKGDPLPAFDLHCPLMSLPLAFGTRLATIPATIPYLRAPPQAVRSWQERMNARRGLKVGLAWSGRPSHPADRQRSIGLRLLRPLLEPDVAFVALQNRITDDDAALIAEHTNVLRLGEGMSDFSDLAALVTALDLVISVDTSFAHLAGALGKPVWIMQRFAPDWRWLQHRDDSPWYPTARLFRQDSTRTWDSVIERIAGELRQLVQRQGGQGATGPAAGHLARAEQAYKAGQFGEAEQYCRQILADTPDWPDALHLLTLVHSAAGNHDKALQSCDRLLAVRPGHVEGQVLRGDELQRLGRYEQALASYDGALAAEPRHARALCNRGAVLHSMKRYQEALTAHDRAIAENPSSVVALSNRCYTLFELQRYDDALASGNRAVTLQPNHSAALSNRGLVLNAMKRFDEALADYDRSLAIEPHNATTHFNVAMTRLLIGDFERGWIEHEWRAKLPNTSQRPRTFPKPMWLGAESIVGKTILLHAEQGLGDTIQFCRYAPMVANRGAHVVLQVQKSLRSLMESLAGPVKVVSQDEPLPAFDVHCPMMSLPLAFGTRLETIPAQVPYLQAPPQAIQVWRERMSTPSGLKVGLAWSGRPAHASDRLRSIGLQRLLALTELQATFVSLQKEVRPEDATVLAARPDILHFGAALEDFSDTAALISQLDLVIAVDTSVAHLAGALGKPVWIMQRHVPDWRWLLDRHDSPWYPTARLFRQDASLDWDGVIAGVREALRELMRQHAQSPTLASP